MSWIVSKIIMKKFKLIKIDIVTISLGLVLMFLAMKDFIPSVISTFYFLLLSFYFFPLKLFVSKREPFEILSDILIALTSVIAILLFYSDFKYLAGIIGLLNIAFIFYYVFFIVNKKGLDKTYRWVILSHFLIVATLNNIG